MPPKEILSRGPSCPENEKDLLTVKLLKFEFPPMRQAMNLPRYACFVNSSQPQFTTHGDLGSAKNAFYNRAGGGPTCGSTRWDGQILELVDGVWFTLHAVTKGTVFRDLPWVKKIIDSTYVENPAYVSFRETPNERQMIVKEYIRYEAKPMTREEYAEWRLAVYREVLVTS